MGNVGSNFLKRLFKKYQKHPKTKCYIWIQQNLDELTIKKYFWRFPLYLIQSGVTVKALIFTFFYPDVQHVFGVKLFTLFALANLNEVIKSSHWNGEMILSFARLDLNSGY